MRLYFFHLRTAQRLSPDELGEIRTLEEARTAAASEPMKRVLEGLRSVGAMAKVVLVERSPFTPEPIRV
jgi:hypothetical protein